MFLRSQSWKTHLDLGANIQQDGSTSFKVWAPFHLSLAVEIEKKGIFPLLKQPEGYFSLTVEEVGTQDCYFYVMENGLNRPDPVSRSLPKGVHGPTQIIDPYSYEWQDGDWKGIDLRDCIFYELHVGTFTSEGTFEAIIEKLDYLIDLGVNCIEIMPVAQFPGRWNWGYDGASLYAPFSGYGGAEGLKQLVDASHQKGIAVCLDVVYNHLGPEGNYLGEFGPYFSEIYHTPWGKAFNYDGAYSDSVRDFVIKNALYWIVEYHIDALRLDALHGIYDFSASPMLPELVVEVKKISEALGKKIHILAETGLNDSRVVRPKEEGGWEMSALWNDDFHHAAHVSLTNERGTYYQDFEGLSDLAKALKRAFIYDGEYSVFRKKRHGNSAVGLSFEKFIVFIQNHDQIGNRPLGERLSVLVGRERLKLAALLLLMTPSPPLLFMGEEYGERAPFEYFVDYEEEQLMRSIYEGRKKEFHKEDMPFPGKESFDNSLLTWDMDRELFSLYRDLIAFRKQNLPKKGITGEDVQVYYSPEEEWLAWEYQAESGKWIGVICYLGKEKDFIRLKLPFKHLSQGKVLLSTQKIASLGGEGELTISSDCAVVVG
ncbi:MAG: malto-oligosyltrehalose trehalohydrolase [Chlamydiales bacterium]